jgi:hypothetical protein
LVQQVCAAHGSDEHLSLKAWVNLMASPPYYPNIITRQPGTQAEVVRLIDVVRRRNAGRLWGIKDSFADLDLGPLGFDLVIEGQWFGGELATNSQRQHHWDVVRHPRELSLWEQVWGGEGDRRVFKDALLDDPRIRFWMQRRGGEIIAGCISFASDPAIGLTNWFSHGTETVFDLGIMNVLQEVGEGRPLVFWAGGGDAARSASGLSALGNLRVWMTRSPSGL